MSGELGTQISTGVISNAIFLIVFAVGAWIKSRLGTSDCKLDCGFLTCNTSLIELEQIKDHLHTTQRNQTNILHSIAKQVVPKSIDEVLLEIKEPTPV